jgi:anion-transporting  ArsA/GET3 family ATPase
VSQPDLLGRRLLVVTGKGGVGKSTVAAALALVAARQGKRVLVVDVDAKGTIAQRFEAGNIGFKPKEVMPGICLLAMDTEASLAEYLRLNLRVPIIGRLGPLAGMLDFVATAAPGVREILTIGKVCWEVRESIEGRADWDLVVVDAAATGHVIAQLGAADAIRDLVAVGPVRGQTEWMSELLADPAITALNVVTTPEEMPIEETIDLVGRARSELDVPLGAVIVNRVLPELFTTRDEAIFARLGEPAVRAELAAAVGPGIDAVFDAAELAVAMRRSRVAQLERLRATVDLPTLYLPYLFARSQGRRETEMVATALAGELGL